MANGLEIDCRRNPDGNLLLVPPVAIAMSEATQRDARQAHIRLARRFKSLTRAAQATRPTVIALPPLLARFLSAVRRSGSTI